MKPEIGVPSLYYATHLDATGEALDDDDYAALRECGRAGASAAARRPSDELTRRAGTLADVAREAGTSPSTASRALSGRGYVSPDARERACSTSPSGSATSRTCRRGR